MGAVMDVMTFPDRVAAKAVTVRPAKVLLSLLFLPFWVLGLAVGVLFVAVAWIWAACVVGFNDGRAVRRERVE
jgi:hypothetical protein